MKDVIIVGAGGHAKVVADIIIKSGDKLIGFLDDNIECGSSILEDYKVLGKTELIASKEYENTYFIIGIGDNFVRKSFYENYRVKYYTAIHPTAVIGKGVSIGEGSCVMAKACINAGAFVGVCSIVNTNAVIEHDDRIRNFVHISPSATICGSVDIGDLTHIGAHATVRNNVVISEEVVVGMSATVVDDIFDKGVYVGTPARLIK